MNVHCPFCDSLMQCGLLPTTSQDSSEFKANRALAVDAIKALVVADVPDGRETQVQNDVLLPTALVSVLLAATEALTVYDVGDDKAHRHNVRTCVRAPERDLRTCASPGACNGSRSS